MGITGIAGRAGPLHEGIASASDAATTLAAATTRDAGAVGARIQQAADAASDPARAGAAALRVRIIADELDGDGVAMLERLRERGADAAIWSVAHLRRADDGTTLYRGIAQQRPDTALVYHPALSSENLALLRSLEEDGIDMMNAPRAIEQSLDKGTTARLLDAAGVAHPRTREVTQPHEVRDAVLDIAGDGRTIFLKNPVGTQGIGVAGLDSVQDAIAVGELVTAVPGGRRLLIQAGVPLPAGEPLSDTRAIVVGDEVVAAMRRVQTKAGEHRTGLHSDGVGEAAELSPAQRETAVRAARAVGLHGVAGVDLIGGTVLEINHGPGHQIGRITGIDVSGLVADAALRRAAAARAAAQHPVP